MEFLDVLRNWPKELVFRVGDRVIARTTISLFDHDPSYSPISFQIGCLLNWVLQINLGSRRYPPLTPVSMASSTKVQ